MLRERKNQIIRERSNGRLRVQIDCGGVSRTDQTQKDQCNINTIMRKAMQTGMLPISQRAQAKYGDFSGGQDFQEIQNRVLKAKQDFAKLPSDIRKKFDNDPGQLIEFINDPENRSEAQELGLIPKDPKPPVALPEPTPEPPKEPLPPADPPKDS